MSIKLDRESRFLYAEDFLVNGKWRDVSLTIKEIYEKGSEKSSEGKVIAGYPIAFEETAKIFVCNKTNARLLKLLAGGNASKLIGMKVTLYPAAGSCFGETNVPWIRVRMPKGFPIPWGIRQKLGKDLTINEVEK